MMGAPEPTSQEARNRKVKMAGKSSTREKTTAQKKAGKTDVAMRRRITLREFAITSKSGSSTRKMVDFLL